MSLIRLAHVLTYDRRKGGGKVLLVETRRLGGKQEDEEIVLLQFKRVVDSSESYYQDMRKVVEKQHTPILTGLRDLSTDRDWEVEVVPLVVEQWSVKE
jgi:hypothetical protein